jgi:hypothetical protein
MTAKEDRNWQRDARDIKSDPRVIFETRDDKACGGRIEVEATTYCTVYVNDAKERLREYNREQEGEGHTVIEWDTLLNYLAAPESLYSYLWGGDARPVDDYSVEGDEFTDFCLERISWDGAA